MSRVQTHSLIAGTVPVTQQPPRGPGPLQRRLKSGTDGPGTALRADTPPRLKGARPVGRAGQAAGHTGRRRCSGAGFTGGASHCVSGVGRVHWCVSSCVFALSKVQSGCITHCAPAFVSAADRVHIGSVAPLQHDGDSTSPFRDLVRAKMESPSKGGFTVDASRPVLRHCAPQARFKASDPRSIAAHGCSADANPVCHNHRDAMHDAASENPT